MSFEQSTKNNEHILFSMKQTPQQALNSNTSHSLLAAASARAWRAAKLFGPTLFAPGASTTFTYLRLYCSRFYHSHPLPLPRPYLSATNVGLSLLLLVHLRGLVLHLSGTGQRTVHLTTSTQTEHQVQGRLLLNVVVRKGAAILKLLSSENQTLLIWGDSLLVLNLSLHILDRIGGLDVESNSLSCELQKRTKQPYQ